MQNFDKMMEDLEMLLSKDIQCVIDKGEITPADYPNLDKAVDILKDLKTIKAMDDYGYETEDMRGVSGRMYPGYSMNSYARGGGNSGNSGRYPMGSYDDYPMNSYERGRSPRTGRYVSRDDGTYQRLEEMMHTAGSDQERQIIQRMMNEIGR